MTTLNKKNQYTETYRIARLFVDHWHASVHGIETTHGLHGFYNTTDCYLCGFLHNQDMLEGVTFLISVQSLPLIKCGPCKVMIDEMMYPKCNLQVINGPLVFPEWVRKQLGAYK
jgi:hypothetical protein